VQRTLRTLILFTLRTFSKGTDKQKTSRHRIAQTTGSHEPLEWKMVVTYSQYMDGRGNPGQRRVRSFSTAFHQPRLRRQRCALNYVMFAMVSRSWQRLLLLTTSATCCVCTKRQVVLSTFRRTPFLPVPLRHNISNNKKGVRAHHKPGRI